MTETRDGDIVQVVLDVIRVEQDGHEFERVIVRGVWPEDAPALPAPLDGAERNIVRMFMGREMNVRTFLIPARPIEEGAE